MNLARAEVWLTIRVKENLVAQDFKLATPHVG